MSAQLDSNVTLGQSIFGNAQLGDKRRTARLVQTFDLMRRHPGGSLPQKMASPADLRAFYRLCDTKDVTHVQIIETVRQHTLSEIQASDEPILILHDATELDYDSLTSLSADLGQIGTGSRCGYICQNVLAVAANTRKVLGPLDQILHLRDNVPEGETLKQSRNRSTRESLLWLKGTQYLPADKRLIDVCDQGSDTFEFLEHEVHSGRRFVIRACKVRKVCAGHTDGGKQLYLKDYAQSLPELGKFTMDIQKQRDRKARKNAKFIVRGGPVLVCPPHARSGHHGNAPLPMFVVLATEANPPAGEKATEWMLLSNHHVKAFDDAKSVIQWYEQRGIVEELHKAMKTGCQIEDMQFNSTARLEPAIALLTVVAVTLLNLRVASRQQDAKTRPATTMLAPEYVELLSMWRYRKNKDLTTHEFYMALARLGGHQNRKSDHRPGWLILWRGWTKLQAMMDGYTAAIQLNKSGKT
ncbi:MAG: IS4 family transposase [Planctomycetaceae bacterium]|nr:IS4 family transposase [Planctomycetaceae bacterium]